MRVLMKVTVPTERGNTAIKDGTLPQVIRGTMERIKPQAAFFGTDGGLRTGYFVFEMKDPSEMPAIAEPLFMALGAQIEVTPVMDAQDLAAGLAKVAL